MPGTDAAVSANPPIVTEKLAAFDRLLPEFETSFRYVQDMHGQKRFQTLTVGDVVRYLHALWVCECKDLLLSVPHSVNRYDGRRALQLLAAWQDGATAEVVAFLQARLDLLPYADITRQWQDAVEAGDERRAARLHHGRLILLSRDINLTTALDAIFRLLLPDLLQQLRTASEQQGHTPEQIDRQLTGMETAAYAYLPHPALARRSMLAMNALGVRVTDTRVDQPGNRTWKVADSDMPALPYAQTVITGAIEQLPSPHGSYGYFPDADAVRAILTGSVALVAPILASEQQPSVES
jgi:hypothetical protein